MSKTSDLPHVSILVVAYNSQAIIGDCLASIPAGCSRFTYEVLLIDNGDGASADLVSAQFPEVMIVPSQGNVGFAAGNNLLAAQASGEHLLLLNPDVVLKPEAIDLLLDATKAYPAASAWGGVTLDRNDRPDLGNNVHIPSLREMASRTLGRSIAGRGRHDCIEQDVEVDALSGSFVMFARSAWDEVGGLDERYFLYCEEVDLFYRLAQRGHRFWRIAASSANHDIGHGEATSPTRELYLNAGIIQFTRLHWSKSGALLAFLLIWISSVQRFILAKMFGWAFPSLAKTGKKQRLVALRPHFWSHGYHPQFGLLAKLRQ